MVEVTDASLRADVAVMTRVHGRSGFATYRVVHLGGVDVFTDPSESGYRQRVTVAPDGDVQVPGRSEVAITVAVADLLDGGE